MCRRPSTTRNGGVAANRTWKIASANCWAPGATGICPVVHIRHDSTDAASPYHPGSSGNDFKPEVAPLPGEPVVDKRTNSAFIGTDLMDVLDEFQVGQLVVTGVLLENSVEATVRMAGNLGFEVVIPEDAVASVDRTDRRGRHWPAEDVHALTLAILEGEYARISDTRTVIEALP